MKKVFLSDSISDADSFSIDELNLIVAPAGSGKEALALALNYRNSCGALYKWGAIKKKLFEQGYTVRENPRTGNRRSETILPPITH